MSQFIQWFKQYPNKHILKYEWRFLKWKTPYSKFNFKDLSKLYPELFCIPQTDQNSLGLQAQAGETYNGFYEFIKMNGFVGWYEPELGNKGIEIDKDIINAIITYWSLNEPEGLNNYYMLFKKFKDGFDFDISCRSKHEDLWSLNYREIDFSRLKEYPEQYNYPIINELTKSPSFFVDYIKNKYRNTDTLIGYRIRIMKDEKINSE